ncbi:MAG: glucose 1-dehydrogenase [Candidatus Latescibacteria bacterium]|nr:glucose 1-dehydrogenase [Candidatus Latescibacterota bacterium]
MSARLTDRIALVTGAASGIGCATSLLFAAEGGTVIAIDRNADTLDNLAADNPAIHPFVADVTDHEALARCVRETVENHGKIDILVNNAGMCYAAVHEESTLAQWRQTQAVNVEAMYALARLVTPTMLERQYGRIVNIASVQGFMPLATMGAYAASKGAIIGWSRGMATELAERNILVNVIAPGAIQTSLQAGNADEMGPGTKESLEKLVEGFPIPAGRVGQPEEVAVAILFLAGEENTYVNGHTLVVDGGMTIGFPATRTPLG